MTVATSTGPAPGWYPDPNDPTALRWWDGRTWTDFVAEVPAVAPSDVEPEPRPVPEPEPQPEPEPSPLPPAATAAGGAVPDFVATVAAEASAPGAQAAPAAAASAEPDVAGEPAPIVKWTHAVEPAAEPGPAPAPEPAVEWTPAVEAAPAMQPAPAPEPAREPAAVVERAPEPVAAPADDGFRAALSAARATRASLSPAAVPARPWTPAAAAVQAPEPAPVPEPVAAPQAAPAVLTVPAPAPVDPVPAVVPSPQPTDIGRPAPMVTVGGVPAEAAGRAQDGAGALLAAPPTPAPAAVAQPLVMPLPQPTNLGALAPLVPLHEQPTVEVPAVAQAAAPAPVAEPEVAPEPAGAAPPEAPAAGSAETAEVEVAEDAEPRGTAGNGRPAVRTAAIIAAGAVLGVGAGAGYIELSGPRAAAPVAPAATVVDPADASCIRAWNTGDTADAAQLRVTLGQFSEGYAKIGRVAPLGGTLMAPDSCALTVYDPGTDMQAVFVNGVKGQDGYLDVTSYPRAGRYGAPRTPQQANVRIQADGSLRAITG